MNRQSDKRTLLKSQKTTFDTLNNFDCEAWSSRLTRLKLVFKSATSIFNKSRINAIRSTGNELIKIISWNKLKIREKNFVEGTTSCILDTLLSRLWYSIQGISPIQVKSSQGYGDIFNLASQ